MTPDRSPHASPFAVLDELAGHPRGDDLARLVHTVGFAAADERRSRLGDGLKELAEGAGLQPDDADTRHGNVLAALAREGATGEARVLLGTLLARGVALSPPDGADAEGRVAEALVWLATHTVIDALPALDAALGERADGLWAAVATLLRRADAGELPALGRAGALVAAAALRTSTSPAARADAAALAGEVGDPVVQALLGDPRGRAASRPDGAGAAHVEGEIVPPPRGPIPLVLLAVTGILLVLRLGRLLGQLALRYRRPAAIEVSARGVTVRTKTELFGRTLKERETHIPIESLLRATREIRYPRLGLYAGLVALGLGTYLGMSLFVDGARAGSPELLGLGALLLALGAALDFGFSHLSPAHRGRCRVVLVPRKGPVVALGGVDPAAADAALGRLVRA